MFSGRVSVSGSLAKCYITFFEMLHSAIAVCEQSLVELRKCHSEADAFLLCFIPRIVVHTCLPGAAHERALHYYGGCTVAAWVVNAACTQYCGEGDEHHDQHAKLPRLDEKPAANHSGLSAYYGMFPFAFMLVYYQTCTSL